MEKGLVGAMRNVAIENEQVTSQYGHGLQGAVSEACITLILGVWIEFRTGQLRTGLAGFFLPQPQLTTITGYNLYKVQAGATPASFNVGRHGCRVECLFLRRKLLF